MTSGGPRVSDARRVHILDGDASGGGHGPGRSLPCKSEFPAGWSDDDCIAAIERVAAGGQSTSVSVEAGGTIIVVGRVEGVNIRVVITADGRSIITTYPTNLPRNGRPKAVPARRHP